jgi:hypothetical protein
MNVMLVTLNNFNNTWPNIIFTESKSYIYDPYLFKHIITFTFSVIK